LTIFEYPSESVAVERSARLGKVPGAFVRAERRSVGIILDPADQRQAEELLRGIDYVQDQEVDFDPFLTDDLTLDGGISTILAGGLVGLLGGILHYLVRWHNGIPQPPLGLELPASMSR
jgi:hypothetical protein